MSYDPEKERARYQRTREKRLTYFKERYQKHKEKLDASRQIWRDKNPDKIVSIWRRQNLKRYCLTPEDYERMFEKQSGQCAICQSTYPGSKRQHFCVDHDHTTGKVRGLLCSPCNKALGMMRDNPELLEKAAHYLIRNYDESL